jgi:predicted PurR-regulated permease PerM
MSELYQKNKLFFLILIIATIGFLVWYFSEIIIIVIVAGVISIIGNPLVETLDKIKIKKFRFPHALSVAVTLILILTIFFGLFSFFIPLVVQEASMISSIDGNKLIAYYQSEIDLLEKALVNFGILTKDATIETILKDNIINLLSFGVFSNILSSVISFTGKFFFNIFSTLFISFFFLYDIKMLPRVLLLLIPEKYGEQSINVMKKSKTLLSRYFIGLIVNVLAMIASYAIVLTIVGVRGALVIAFFGGIINIIPYIGPVIAVITGIILGVTGVIGAGFYGAILAMAVKILLSMMLVIIIDNAVYAPLIQGKSVRAHPVEIFLVIIAAGSIGGIPAMITAVPGYAFLRIVASEFLSNFRLVRKMTEKT